MKPRLAILIATLLTLLALGAQALASGRNDTYSGPLSETGPPQPTINLYVHTQRHRDGRVVVKITNIVLLDAYYTCSDGKSYAPGSTGGNRSKLTFTGEPIKLKRRSFSRTLIEDSSQLYLKLSGRIPKHGPASGTARLTEAVGPPLGNCDSGELTWTAPKQ
jgi:hypothetical protein